MVSGSGNRDFYPERYALAFAGEFARGRKHYVGAKTPRWCRFCGRDGAQTSFRSAAHAIPEFLGNRQLVLREECDACNRYVAVELERHLDAYTRPMRTLGQILGRTGVPSLRAKDKRSRVDFVQGAGLKIHQYPGSPLVRLDEEKKEVIATIDIEPHVPTAVYKALVKIALSVLPRELLVQFKTAIRWIMNPDHARTYMSPHVLRKAMVPGPGPVRGVAISVLIRRAESRDFYCMLVIAFGNLIFHVPIPSEVDAASAPINSQWPEFPTRFDTDWPFGKPKWEQIDMSGTSLVRNSSQEIRLRFNDAVETKIETAS